mgnify:CR=1 FL=1
MTAEIIDLWVFKNKINRHKLTKALANEVPTAPMEAKSVYQGFVKHMQDTGQMPKRTPDEIMADLRPLRMTGDEDAIKRQVLIAEYQAAVTPLDW